MGIMSKIYSDKEFRLIHRDRRSGMVIYEVWTTGWFPRFLFRGHAFENDFLNFISEFENEPQFA